MAVKILLKQAVIAYRISIYKLQQRRDPRTSGHCIKVKRIKGTLFLLSFYRYQLPFWLYLVYF